jgi:hypothetical protein
MPAPHLDERLVEKRRGRVVRSDTGLPEASAAGDDRAEGN